MDNALIVFLKYPEPGKVKTRIAGFIGDERACALYTLIAEGVIKNVFLENPGTYDVYIFFTPANTKDKVEGWLKVEARYRPQEGDTLGEKMSNAFQSILQNNGYKRSIIIGTDCPEVNASLIESAFEMLKEKDIVIGPCKDGGYYLLGMSRFVSDVFLDIDWSTDRVISQTVNKVCKNDLSYGILKTLEDVDTPDDMYRYLTSIDSFKFMKE